MISRFFIDRPIFANVIAIITLLFGVVALFKLPVERYPQITPPTVQVTTNYPGANAKIVADTVAAPIEQQINGVENMMYMSSTSSSDGSYSLTITFEIGTNLEEAAGSCAESRRDRGAAVARRSAAAGRLGEEAGVEHHHGDLADGAATQVCLRPRARPSRTERCGSLR
ncbi:MAG: efflux RND transporter permease subunit [Gemmataceae bacterium]